MNIAILLAGGVGNRLGAGIPKQYVKVMGKPLIVYALERYQVSKLIEEKPNELRGFIFLADMFYNGTDLLCNPAGGSMIRLLIGQ